MDSFIIHFSIYSIYFLNSNYASLGSVDFEIDQNFIAKVFWGGIKLLKPIALGSLFTKNYVK